MTPQRERRPYEGLKPTTPVYAAGSRTEPPVSVPRALLDISCLDSIKLCEVTHTRNIAQRQRLGHYPQSFLQHSILLPDYRAVSLPRNMNGLSVIPCQIHPYL